MIRPDETLADGNRFLDFPSDIVFTEPFDFWDPEIAFHEMIPMNGSPDTSALSHAVPLSNESRELDFMQDQQNLRGVILDKVQVFSHSAQHSAPHQRMGKISGLQSLKPHTGVGDHHKRILPGLYIRKDAFNNNFIGIIFLIHS